MSSSDNIDWVSLALKTKFWVREERGTLVNNSNIREFLEAYHEEKLAQLGLTPESLEELAKTTQAVTKAKKKKAPTKRVHCDGVCLKSCGGFGLCPQGTCAYPKGVVV